MTFCEACGRPIEADALLSVTRRPDRLYWKGERVPGAYGSHARIVSLLLKRGMASHDELCDLIGPFTTPQTLYVTLSRLRRSLSHVAGDAVTIRNSHGKGYELIVVQDA